MSYTVRLGVAEELVSRYLPKILAWFSEAAPSVEVQVTSAGSCVLAHLTGNLATATVDEPSRILAISKLRMAKITASGKQISAIIYKLLGREIASKMRNSNMPMASESNESVIVGAV